MKAVLGLLFFVLLIAALGAWWLNNEPSPQRADVQPELSSTTSRPMESATPGQTTADESMGIEAASQRVDDTKFALQTIVAERKHAEAQLEQAERDVAELERFIENIEARGEDPADYADEGLEMFQPAFYAYQEAFDKLELVESTQQTAEEQVAAAEKQLARILAESDGE